MQIELIAPASEDSALLPRLGLGILAALTPKEDEVIYTDYWWLGGDHDAGSPYFVPARMTREQLHEGWQRAWQRFYEPSAIFKRWTVRRKSSWIQTLGYLPINVMQNRLVKHKILGGAQRFRSSADFSPLAAAFDAIRLTAERDGGETHAADVGPKRLRVMGE